jgi:hypothetical protein
MRRFLSAFFLLITAALSAQDSLPKFGSPLEIPLILSGNFAELRRNHFHTGIDIKTLGVEGQRVVAAEGGVVSRINVSPYGYGKAIYIDHPNGYTTVYAHLKSFSPKVDAVLKAEQYRQESFKVDFKPEEPLEVTRGEFIALSGNSGGSGGAHLHFEIRNTATERAQNPLKFEFAIEDDIPPRIRGLRFHPLTDTTLINGKNEAMSFVVSGDKGKYNLKAGEKIEVYGAFGLSLHTLDFLNAASNKCGIYNLELTVDGKQICNQSFDEIDFSTSRHINCYKDYDAYRKNSWHYHKSFKEPGNALEIYHPEPPNDGVMHFTTAGTHQALYQSVDAYGNISELPFSFTSLAAPNGPMPPVEPYDAYFFFNRDNSFEYRNDFSMNIPSGALYRDLRFQFSVQMQTDVTCSPFYLVHNDMVPLDKNMVLEFTLGQKALQIKDKLLAARYPTAGGPSYITGTVEGDKFKIQTRDFGKYTLIADTIAPKVIPEKYAAGGKVSAGTPIGFTIADDVSGIGKHEARLNGKWILMEYEPKQKRIWCYVRDVPFVKGENVMELKVTDQCGNTTTGVYKYTY